MLAHRNHVGLFVPNITHVPRLHFVAKKAHAKWSSEARASSEAGPSAPNSNENSQQIDGAAIQHPAAPGAKQTAQQTASAPSSAVGEAATQPANAAAADPASSRDWVPPLPGDWGGAPDPAGIREPDRAGAVFFVLLTVGLSVGVHQLVKLAGGQKPRQQPVLSPAVAVAVGAPTSLSARPGTSVSASTPHASTETPPGVTSSSSSSTGTTTSASSSLPAKGATGSQIASKPSPSAIEHAEEGRDGKGTEATEAATPSTSRAEPGAPRVRGSTEDGASDLSTTMNTEESEEDVRLERAAAARAETTAVEQQAAAELPPSSATAGPGSRDSHHPTTGVQSGPSAGAAPAGAVAAGVGAAVPHAPATSPFGRPPQPAPSTAGTGSGVASQHQPGLVRSGSGTGSFFGSANGRGHDGAITSTPLLLPHAGLSAAAQTPESHSPAALGQPPRLSFPPVRPEPLSRAPDTSALSHLAPDDTSLHAMKERAQLALRGAAAASEASQRAAAYAAAASSAASKAAEAAERAAVAATAAQAGLESAAESAIVAAEARVAQAAEAAKEAEERAASAAAHATAYQDMSQSQADIAERAASVLKRPPPGPLDQLQQLWRSVTGQSHSNSSQRSSATTNNSSGLPSTGAQRPGSGGSASAGGSSESGGATGPGTGGSSGGGSAGGGSRSASVAAAENLGSTVKGLLSWLGQGDGSR